MPLFSGLPFERIFEEVSLEECPEMVAESIERHLSSGRIERILAARGGRRPYFFVEVALADRHVCKLQISEEGVLISRVDGIRRSELPETVRSTVTHFLKAGARFDAADRVCTSVSEEFHIELDLGNNLDLHLFLDERGVVLRRHEVGDF